jgi:hypothetical protein
VTIPKDIIEECKKETNVLFETGMCKGDGIQIALDCGFEKIFSVDIDKRCIDVCTSRFKHNKNVSLLFNSSDLCLKEISEDKSHPLNIEKCCIILDAHLDDAYGSDIKERQWPEHIKNRNSLIKKTFGDPLGMPVQVEIPSIMQSDCPLIEELIHISNLDVKNHILIIDDFRIIRNKIDWASKAFENTNPKELITNHIKEINKNYTLKFHDSEHGPEDIIIARIENK